MSDEADEFLMTDEPEPLVKNGMYRLTHPETGKAGRWSRASKLGEILAERFMLEQWQQRMIVVGLAMKPDLLESAALLDPNTRDGKDKLNALASKAKDLAGARRAAAEGTKVHKLTERIDLGQITIDDVPPKYRADIVAYREELERKRLRVVPELIERTTFVPGYDIAGTFDRVYQEMDGQYIMGDVKTKQSLDFGLGEIEIQLAEYAFGFNTSGVWNRSEGVWEKPDGIFVRTDKALVVHMPVGSGTCEAREVNIAAGAADLRLCADVKAWRSRKREAPEYFPPEARDWAAEFGAVTTRAGASALYREAKAAGVTGMALDVLVSIGRTALDRVSQD